MNNNSKLFHFSDARVQAKTIYITDRKEAEKAAQSRGEWGADACVWEKDIYVVDTAKEYEQIVHAEETQRALKKLNERELALIKEHFNLVNAGPYDDR